ncbi:Activator of (R)-2-hydroxyglutaryl-CoA dehydratase [Candidatus Syntrophocurvum alkaliphilum]|uniref:Activator of (R)-2-hydroxyglutaryl-CoA dehydratase n=1 Tax=Candidatus Syntrophocurvum alkaliphilum TaxID=2293317 RepID=A0A6I6D7A1_9FIRM|nr:acyl-CoA dehydratase activase-related protein [Candidatus Syntrophocurvum alkaliphilum]QGT99003.1 Activator of (R)-2-hydroxyglutaryl-CoA dehydratase [Candidatus Syntrophocurvum alkaliphilum]
MIKVGIPRGLFYFYYYPLWKTFFENLGAEVVTSSETNNKIVSQGIDIAVDETCFPVKVYYGHVNQLCNENIDYIFIPRIVSVELRSYICPKFMGIPDMIRASFNNLPYVIDITIDLSRNNKELKKEIIKVGQLFTSNKKAINNAYQNAIIEQKRFNQISKEGYTLDEAIKLWEGLKIKLNTKNDLKIGVFGHGYSIYDQAISMNIINKLREMECQAYIPEMLDKKIIEKEASTLPKRVFWTIGRKMVGGALHMDKRTDIDGIIYVSCFGCGPDSIVGEVIERKVKNKPFMLITVDEHTGEAGLVTRLEAFCDMLRRRKSNNESNISAHG